MSPEDEKLLGLKLKGRIKVDETKLSTVSLSKHFNHFHSIITHRWNLKAESGRRTLIDLFILESFASLNQENPLAVFPEHTISETEIFKDVVVKGKIDYVVASTTHSMEGREERLKLGTETVEKPYTCIFEAKKDQTLGESINFLLLSERRCPNSCGNENDLEAI